MVGAMRPDWNAAKALNRVAARVLNHAAGQVLSGGGDALFVEDERACATSSAGWSRC